MSCCGAGVQCARRTAQRRQRSRRNIALRAVEYLRRPTLGPSSNIDGVVRHSNQQKRCVYASHRVRCTSFQRTVPVRFGRRERQRRRRNHRITTPAGQLAASVKTPRRHCGFGERCASSVYLCIWRRTLHRASSRDWSPGLRGASVSLGTNHQNPSPHTVQNTEIHLSKSSSPPQPISP